MEHFCVSIIHENSLIESLFQKIDNSIGNKLGPFLIIKPHCAAFSYVCVCVSACLLEWKNKEMRFKLNGSEGSDTPSGKCGKSNWEICFFYKALR